jgi:hypothetical protein
MDTELLKDTIKRERPGLLREDPGLRAYLLELTRPEYAGRLESEDRFYQILGELRRDREEQTRKWEEQNRKWDAQRAENRDEFQRVHEEIMALARKQIAASGRWERAGGCSPKRHFATHWPESWRRASAWRS